ncbi:GreA/GreB family elongation factor [Candidatus Shapirobacteria bacterium]|nr:GreA/GreB family elongation factor [Candidatus Shapirobacteria bacterium]
MSLITQLGLDNLTTQIQELKSELTRTYDERQAAAAEGDLKENSAYIFLGERAQVLQSQIDQLETDLKESTVATAPTQTNTVEFGHQVTIFFETDKRQITLTLVGKNDARLRPDWVSADSPLGIALLGQPIGTKVMVNDQPVSIQKISLGQI